MELFQHPNNKTPKQVFDDAIALAVHAEELGFDTIWLAEHHFSAYGIAGSPLVLAAAIAERTTTINIGTAVVVLPFYDPIRLAEDCAVVDHLSEGRLRLGVGRGYQPEEFRGFGVDQSQSRQIAAETIEVMRRAWTDDLLNFEGEHYQYEDLAVLPKPYQQPHPPIYQAAVSLESFDRAGKEGSPILTSPNFTPMETIRKQFTLYTDALKEAGHDPDDFARPLMQQVYVGEDEQNAYEAPRESAMWYQALLATVVPGAKEAAPRGYEQWDKIAENIKNISYDDVYNGGANFGETDRVLDHIRQLQEVAGVTSYIGWFTFGGLERAIAEGSMERFAKTVMPEFK